MYWGEMFVHFWWGNGKETGYEQRYENTFEMDLRKTWGGADRLDLAQDGDNGRQP
jgi:hypothetical protein